ncbi:MAG: cyanophycinase [Thiobacillus sp.]|nr:cyanophycinase [Thiobacillus sp.]
MKKWAWFLIAMLCSFSVLAGKLPYTYARIGSPDNVSVAGLPGGMVLMGGGYDVDDAFKWMCNRVGKGDFLVIRATGTDAYNPYVQSLCPGLNSVATLIIPTVTAANDARVKNIILNAEAIWIAGGDQSNYINYWANTEVQNALNSMVAAGVPIGGTSAGLNVLTQYIYSALASQGVTSAQALANPYNKYMSFSHDFVNLPDLAGVIGDPHFGSRDRMGRDLAFLCRVNKDYGVEMPRGISVDEETALLIDETGMGSVVGKGNVYFLKAPGAPETCKAKMPLTYTNVGVYRINASGTFNVGDVDWSTAGTPHYKVNAINGVLSSTQSGGAIY